MDQVHKYLELLNRQQDVDDDQRRNQSSTSDIALTSLATSTPSVTTVSVSLTGSDTEKTADVTESTAADTQ